MDNYPVEWDNTADMETGAVASDTEYYLYITTDGETKISLERPYDRIGDLRGRYHPYNNWRYICRAKTDGSSDWISVQSSSAFDTRSASVRFESQNLIIEVTSSTEVTVTYDWLKLINADGRTKTIYKNSHVFDITAHNQGTELASHWYQLWIDSNLNLKMVPDLTGTTTGTTSGFLVDSGNAFASYSVFKTAVIYNTTDNTQTTCSVSATTDTNDLAVTDDFFTTTEDYTIHMLDPVGLGEFRANIGEAYNDGSSNLTKVRKHGEARITESFWHTANGYGSSSTKIQKFTTEVVASDNIVATVENSATLGFTITANMDCVLTVVYSAIFNGVNVAGFSKNSTELTTNLTSITTADRYGMNYTPGADESASIAFSHPLKKGDVVRPHTNATADSIAPDRASIIVKATEII
jgi:hypothetical protein